MPLYLLPNLLSKESDPKLYLPSILQEVVPQLSGLIAESEREGRRFLKYFRSDGLNVPIALMREPISFLLEPLCDGEAWGVVSDCGLPSIADPGAELIKAAHKKQVEVIAYAGPCSVTLSLMQSGLVGQRFAFYGYISRDPVKRKEELLLFEKRGHHENSTQIFIEAPHRNHHTFNACLETLADETKLCIASNLTAPNQNIETKPIRTWKKRGVKLGKVPTIFLIARP